MFPLNITIMTVMLLTAGCSFHEQQHDELIARQESDAHDQLPSDISDCESSGSEYVPSRSDSKKIINYY